MFETVTVIRTIIMTVLYKLAPYCYAIEKKDVSGRGLWISVYQTRYLTEKKHRYIFRNVYRIFTKIINSSYNIFEDVDNVISHILLNFRINHT